MEQFQLLNNIAVALGLAFAGGYLARLAGLSTIVGYLAAGIVISPFTPGYEANPETLRALAELGVIFLMFGIGLHFNLVDLLAVKWVAIPGTLVRVVVVSLGGIVVGHFVGLGVQESLVLGMAVSICSSVVLARSLHDHGLIDSISGRIAIGSSIVEDLLTVLILALLPVIADRDHQGFVRDLSESVGKSAAFLALMLVLGPLVIPRVLRQVASLGSRELFIVAVVTLALGIATGGTHFGVSIALGAFVAGVVVSETEMGHQATADVLPLREAFAVLFFVSVGMLLDPGELLDHFDLLALTVLLVMGVKAATTVLSFAVFPYPARVALLVGAALAQMGEFSFLIADEALDLHLVSAGTYNVILGASVASIALNPVAWSMAPKGERWLRGTGPIWRILNRAGPPLPPAPPAAGHVVILGYGRVGELTGHALSHLDVPYIVVDADLAHVRRLVQARTSAVVWGDAASLDVLEQTSLRRARLVVIALPDENSTVLAVTNVRRLNPEVPIVVRARSREELPLLYHLTVQEVVVPEYEGGLELMRQALVGLGYNGEEAMHYSLAVRDTHYGVAGALPDHG